MKGIFTALLALFLSTPVLAAKLSNGAPLFSSVDADLPRNTFIISYLGGPSLLSPEQQGVVQVLKETLKEGPSSIPLNEFKERLFALGADIEYSSQANVFEIVVRVPPAEQAKAFELLKQTLSSPRTNKEDFERIRRNVLATLKAGFEDMRSVIMYFAPRDVVSYSPHSMTGETSPNSLGKLTHEEFLSGTQKIFNDQRMFVSYVGPQSESEAKKAFESAFAERLKKPFQSWKPEKPSLPQVEKPRYTVIDKPGATDNQIVLVFAQPIKRDGAEWAHSKVVMDLLGGGLHGRLPRILRTERGLTYGARSGFNSSNLPLWIVYTFGGIEQTKPLIEGAQEIVASFKKEQLKGQEIEEAKARVINDYKSETELPKDRMRETVWYYVNGLNPASATRFVSDVQKAKLTQISKFKNSLNSSNPAVYLMGDKENMLKALESTGVKRESVKVITPADIR